MKAIILAGGYAKRMYPITKEFPKPLLEVKGKKIINYILDSLEKVSEIDEVYLSTNKKFASYFQFFINTISFNKKISLLVENSNSNDNKLGAVKALNKIINQKKITEDLLIIGGDNLFKPELENFMKFFKEKDSVTLMVYNLNNENAKNFGVVGLDEQNKIINFEEKPSLPKSSLISTACYLFKKDHLSLIDNYIKETNSNDNLGDLISWLSKNGSVYAYVHQNFWFDVGNLETLKNIESLNIIDNQI